MDSEVLQLLAVAQQHAPAASPAFVLERARVLEVADGGTVFVATSLDDRTPCDLLVTVGLAGRLLEAGDEVLVFVPCATRRGVVIGRIAGDVQQSAEAHVTIRATESLKLQCGAASVELRADGQAMVKGEDVLLRAKGTQRIRAGNVAIN